MFLGDTQKKQETPQKWRGANCYVHISQKPSFFHHFCLVICTPLFEGQRKPNSLLTLERMGFGKTCDPPASKIWHHSWGILAVKNFQGGFSWWAPYSYTWRYFTPMKKWPKINRQLGIFHPEISGGFLGPYL